MLALLGWFVARERLIPRRAITPEEELAGHTASLLCLGALSLLVVATNPFALVFLLPSLHVWLWLPQVRGAPVAVRLGVLVAGFAGPALLVGSFALRFGLGWDTPWYLAELRAARLRARSSSCHFSRLAGGHRAARCSRNAAVRALPGSQRAPPTGPLRRSCAQPFSACATAPARAPAAVQEALEG